MGQDAGHVDLTGHIDRGGSAMRRTTEGIIAVMAVTVALVIGPAASAGLTATEVEGGPGDQIFGQVNTDWEVWTSNSADHPNAYNAYGRMNGSARFRINPAGTRGYAGTLLDDTSQAIYQKIDGASSNIYLYDLSTQTQSSPGAGVNSDLWEWQPAVSDGFVLFGRNSFRTKTSPWKVILYDRTALTSTVLDSVTNRCRCIYPGQVTDQYATWTKCTGICQVWVYSIAGEAKVKAPNPSSQYQYYPGVSSESPGDIYFVGASDCGSNTQILHWNPLGKGDPTVVSTLPNGFNVSVSLRVTDDAGGHQDLYFDRQVCSGHFYADVYKLEDVDVLTFTRDRATPSATGGMRLPAPGARPSG
jgi:hypothetical protein